MSGTSILVVHRDRKTQRAMQRILGVTGYRIDIADDLEQAQRLLEHAVPVLIVLGGEVALAPAATRFFAAARARGAEQLLTLLPDAGEVPRVLGLGAVTNLLVHPMPVLAEELTTTAHKLIRRDLFGAEKYLLWGTELRAFTLARASERADRVRALGDQVRSLGQSARVASMAMLVADELISNAVHNAPVDATGAHVCRELPRDREIELDDRARVAVRWGCDARHLAIEVTDQWGSLDQATILSSLAKTAVRESGGGAGMGMALAYRSCDQLVFNLAPGRRTQVIAMIDVRYSAIERVPGTSGPGGPGGPGGSSYNIFVERPSHE